jgi:hypothetical protein
MHKSHAKVISGTVVDFVLPNTQEFKGTTRKTVRVESERTVRQAIHALFRHLRYYPLIYPGLHLILLILL